MLKFIAEERGYNPGWAAHKFREKFGNWPNGFRSVLAQPPSSEVRNWVKSRLIAFAKSQGGRRYG
jgi:DNA repair protein RadD